MMMMMMMLVCKQSKPKNYLITKIVLYYCDTCENYAVLNLFLTKNMAKLCQIIGKGFQNYIFRVVD